MREPVEELFPRLGRPVYRTGVLTVGGAVKRLYRVAVEGLEHIPADAPAIVAANHVSFLDPVAITTMLPRRITYLVKSEIWNSARTRWLFTVTGQIPVERGSPNNDASLTAGLRVLAFGGLLGIHPEGTRSPDGRLYRGHTGAARLAATSRAVVIPAGVSGTHAIFPKERRLPKLRGRIHVRFGAPMWWPADKAPTDTALRDFTDEVMHAIAALSGQEHRDEYSTSRATRSSAPR